MNSNQEYENQKKEFYDTYLNLSEEISEDIVLQLPWNKKITFHRQYVEYNDKTIYYKEITGIQYNAIDLSVNFIPVSQSRYFNIYSEKNNISIDTSSTLFIKNKERKNIWLKLISISKSFIEPLIIRKVLRGIFENNISLDIDGLVVDKDGYKYSRKYLWCIKSEGSVSWNEIVYLPCYKEGNVQIYKDVNNKPHEFFSISMERVNSIILPELFAACSKWNALKQGKIITKI